MSDSDDDNNMARVPTGISGVDQILRGGLLKGGVYIIQGAPGAGKTIFANQVCFNHVARGGRTVFMTLLAESHTRMLQHMRPMAFFNASAIPNLLYYVSGFDILETDGLKGIVDLLRREIKGHRASLLVIDGFGITEESASSQRDFKKFVHEIQSHAAAAECTILLLTNGTNRAVTPEYTMVDGLIELEDHLYQDRSERTLRLPKFRGSAVLQGRHPFRITGDGIVAYPRIETCFVNDDRPPMCDLTSKRMATGIIGLDELMEGGLPAKSTNALYGPTGVGKTTFGLQYLSKCTQDEPGLLFGFYEDPACLRHKASAFGIDLQGMEDRGELEIVWRPQGEHILDQLGHEICDAVSRRRVKRLFIDGFGGFKESAVRPERMTRFVSALGNELRRLEATTIMTMESRDILGTSPRLPDDGMSALLQGLLVMRYTEVRGQLLRVVSITKIRDSGFDPFLHDFTIGDRGIEIGGTFQGFEALMSGYGREPAAAADASQQGLGA